MTFLTAFVTFPGSQIGETIRVSGLPTAVPAQELARASPLPAHRRAALPVCRLRRCLRLHASAEGALEEDPRPRVQLQRQSVQARCREKWRQKWRKKRRQKWTDVAKEDEEAPSVERQHDVGPVRS